MKASIIILYYYFSNSILMMNGADPTVKDKKSLTAYDHAPDKPTRNVFCRFMGEFPDRYEYKKVFSLLPFFYCNKM